MGNSYRDLQVWQRAIELVTDVYKITQSFPKDEGYGLSSQIRRAVVSVPSNIAEGQGRVSSREFHQFLSQARGSLMEVETQLIIACNLGYLDQESLNSLLGNCMRIKQMLYRLMQSLAAYRTTSNLDGLQNGKRETGNGKRSYE